MNMTQYFKITYDVENPNETVYTDYNFYPIFKDNLKKPCYPIYKDGLNVLDNLDDCGDLDDEFCPNGLYFFDINQIQKHYGYGTNLHIVEIPCDPDFRMVKHASRYRSNKIILGKKYSLLNLETYKKFGLDVKNNHHFIIDASYHGKFDLVIKYHTLYKFFDDEYLSINHNIILNNLCKIGRINDLMNIVQIQGLDYQRLVYHCYLNNRKDFINRLQKTDIKFNNELVIYTPMIVEILSKEDYDMFNWVKLRTHNFELNEYVVLELIEKQHKTAIIWLIESSILTKLSKYLIRCVIKILWILYKY